MIKEIIIKNYVGTNYYFLKVVHKSTCIITYYYLKKNLLNIHNYKMFAGGPTFLHAHTHSTYIFDFC